MLKYYIETETGVKMKHGKLIGEINGHRILHSIGEPCPWVVLQKKCFPLAIELHKSSQDLEESLNAPIFRL